MPPDSMAQTHHRRRSRRSHGGAKSFYESSSPVRLLVTSGLIVLLLALSIHAGSLGLANLQVIRVENTLKQWHKAGRAPSEQAVTLALRAIDRAMDLHADNPHQYTLKARLFEWRGFSVYKARQAEADFRMALDLHRRAAVLRPLWPNTWAEMINLKLRLNELDEELDGFIARADELGPYTAPVHVAIVQAGFAKLAHSPLLGDLPLLEKHLLRGVRDPRTQGRIKSLIQQYGQEVLFCRWNARAPEKHHELGLCGKRKAG